MIEGVLRRKLLRMQQRIDALETIIEDRSREVFVVNRRLKESLEFLEDIYRTMPQPLFIIDELGAVQSANVAAATLLDYATPDDLTGKPTSAVLARPHHLDPARASPVGGVLRSETTLLTRTGGHVPVLLSASPLQRCDSSPETGWVCVAVDLRERQKLEIELRHAQKLESVGRLAAGVAHEINTPTQFVSDSMHFAREAVDDVFRVLEQHEVLRQWATTTPSAADLVANIANAEAEADLPYLLEQLPKALDRALEGLGRVATIVRSLKEFAHPDEREMTLVDLNRVIASTLDIARHEYKYVAEVDMELGELPLVTCHAGDVNQAVLNILVNAAHAIADAVKGSDETGRITVRSWHEGEQVVISIQDTGGGIPDWARDRVFDPFFTTKEVGRGTGQGLAITRAIVVDKHRGTITFDTRRGVGTTFFIRLPIAGRRSSTRVDAA